MDYIKLITEEIESHINRIVEQSEKTYDYGDGYDYKVVNGKWFASKEGANKWFSMDKYPNSIKNLDRKFPQARKSKNITNTTFSFKDSKEGNSFRKYVNDTYPSIAKKYDLDIIGKHNNSYIMKVASLKMRLLKDINGHKKGETTSMYNLWDSSRKNITPNKSSNKPDNIPNYDNIKMDRPDTSMGSDTIDKMTGGLMSNQTIGFFSNEIEKASKLIGKISQRSYDQLINVMEHKGMKDDSFVIVNKDAAIASLFGTRYEYVTSSSITTGYYDDTSSDDDKLTYPKWWEITKEWVLKNKNSKDYKEIEEYANEINVKVEDLDYYKHIKGKKGKLYSYNAIKEKGYTRTPSGVYSVGKSHNVPYYSGEGNNIFPLVDIETGEKLAQALHGAAGKRREEIINKASSDELESFKDYTRAGSGCVNVDANFIKNVQTHKPDYIIILPDSGQDVELPKIVTMDNWTDKIVSIGPKCVKSLFNLFS